MRQYTYHHLLDDGLSHSQHKAVIWTNIALLIIMVYSYVSDVSDDTSRASSLIDKVYEYLKDPTQPSVAPNYIYGVISRKCATDHFEIQQTMDRFTVHDPRRGPRSGPRICHEKLAVVLLWRHNSGHGDKAASIAAHGNALFRTMTLTFTYLSSNTI